MIGAISELPCIPPGARCAPRGGVLVSTLIERHRIVWGWYASEMWSPADRPSPTTSYGPLSTIARPSSAMIRPSLRKPIFTRECSAGRARPIHCSSSRVTRIITGTPAFFERNAGTTVNTVDEPLLPNPPPQYSADDHHVLRLDADPARDGADRPHGALRRAVHVELAVLPVRHRAARLERLVRRVGADERLVHHEIGAGHRRVHVAHDPLVRRLAERELAVAGGREVGLGPLDFAHDRAGRLVGVLGARPHVALFAGIGAARAQRLERIHDERQRLEVDLDGLDRGGGGLFVDGGHGENRLARVERLHREAALAERAGDDALAEARALGHARQVVGGDDRLHAFHGLGGARVDARHARMRPGAHQELGEQHALGAEVLAVPRAAGDLGVEIGGGVVLADEFHGGLRREEKRWI